MSFEVKAFGFNSGKSFGVRIDMSQLEKEIDDETESYLWSKTGGPRKNLPHLGIGKSCQTICPEKIRMFFFCSRLFYIYEPFWNVILWHRVTKRDFASNMLGTLKTIFHKTWRTAKSLYILKELTFSENWGCQKRIERTPSCVKLLQKRGSQGKIQSLLLINYGSILFRVSYYIHNINKKCYVILQGIQIDSKESPKLPKLSKSL